MLLSELQSCLRTECFMIGGVESSSLRSSYLTLPVWNQHFKNWANVVMVRVFSAVLYPRQKLHPTVWAWVEEGNPHFLGLFTYNSLSNCLYLGSEWKMLMSYPSWEDISLWPGARERGNLIFLVAFTCNLVGYGGASEGVSLSINTTDSHSSYTTLDFCE